jgi:hypothetical protein
MLKAVQPQVAVFLHPADGRDMLQVAVFGLVKVMQGHTGGYNAQRLAYLYQILLSDFTPKCFSKHLLRVIAAVGPFVQRIGIKAVAVKYP